MTGQNQPLKLADILSSTFDELRAAGDTTTHEDVEEAVDGD